MTYSKITYPKKITKGATIGLVCPAGGFDDYKPIQKVVKYLKFLGFNVKLGNSLLKSKGLFDYLSGPDSSRVSDFNKFILSDDVDAIFCLRGGYGTLRILDKIDYKSILKKKKIILGYSDITSLLLAVFKKSKLLVFHSPMLGVKSSTKSMNHMWELLSNAKYSFNYKIPSKSKVLKNGRSIGRLLGGNLSVLASMLGSPYLPDFNKSILFLEDCNESVYKLDRLFTQLAISGVLKKISGLILGDFINCGFMSSSDLKSFFLDKMKKYNIPIVLNFPLGHGKDNLILPVGSQVLLDTNKLILKSV